MSQKNERDELVYSLIMLLEGLPLSLLRSIYELVLAYVGSRVQRDATGKIMPASQRLQ